MKNLLAGLPPYVIAIIAAIVLTAAIVIGFKLFQKSREARYVLKDRLLTGTEIEYFRIIDAYFGKDYRVLPQINLASIIDKEGEGFRTELFRNVDFGIFDFNFRPILLIEINDDTHFRKDRAERDIKVNTIAKKARIPLVTFWTKDGMDKETIYKTIKRYL